MDDIDHLQKDSLDTTAPSPVVVANLKQYLLPRSIISIDVGIRNLAWVELSSRGEILRWDIENLVPETDAATHEGGEDTLDESIIPSPPPPSLSPSPSPSPDTPTTTTSTTKSQKKTKKPTKKKPMASSFDPRTVALRLDEIMQKIMGSQDISAIIIERQRFRTGGMHAVLDVTFKCGVVEGMIHTWLTFWDNQRVIRGASSKTKRIIIESIAPRSVGSWWGIGVGSTSAAYTKPSPPETLRDSVDDAEDIKKMTDIRDSGDRNAAAVTKETRAESHVYATKKKQARTIVDNWIRSAVSESDTFTQWQGSGDHSMRVSCSPTIRDWYMQEKKRDDLSDCLLQAVAWYEWRGYAIDEAISRKIAAIKLVKSVS
ncbi:hypothetical protein BG004_005014 [Podila humilis]|nr:hypothetical protein BG004_005014 [Podila humilis]